MKKMALAFTAAMILSGGAFAGKNVVPVQTEVVPVMDPWYVGIGYSNLKMDLDCTGQEYYLNDPIGAPMTNSADDRTNGIVLLGGYEFNEYLAVEGRWTVAPSDFTFGSGDEAIDISYYNVALYLKPQYKMGDFSVYGLLGFGYSHFKVDGGNIDDGDSDFQYGVGLSYRVTENLSLFADYTVLYDEDKSDVFHYVEGDPVNGTGYIADCDVKVDSFNVGFTYRF